MSTENIRAARPIGVASDVDTLCNNLSQARTIRELISSLPITYRPTFGPLLKELYRAAQQCASVEAAYQSHKDYFRAGTLPTHLKAIKPISLQVSKEFAGTSDLRDLQKTLDKEAKSYVERVLALEVQAKKGEWHALLCTVSSPTCINCINSLCDAIDRDLCAHMFYTLPPISKKNKSGFVGHRVSSWHRCLLVSLRCLSGASWCLLVSSELAVFLLQTVLKK